jgi:hypothetical protein
LRKKEKLRIEIPKHDEWDALAVEHDDVDHRDKPVMIETLAIESNHKMCVFFSAEQIPNLITALATIYGFVEYIRGFDDGGEKEQ